MLSSTDLALLSASFSESLIGMRWERWASSAACLRRESAASKGKARRRSHGTRSSPGTAQCHIHTGAQRHAQPMAEQAVRATWAVVAWSGCPSCSHVLTTTSPGLNSRISLSRRTWTCCCAYLSLVVPGSIEHCANPVDCNPNLLWPWLASAWSWPVNASPGVS